MSESISVYYYNMGLGLTYHKRIIYTKSDGSSAWIDSLRGSGGTIVMGRGDDIPKGASGHEVIATSDLDGGLASQWELMNQTMFDVYKQSLDPNSEWKYQWTHPFYNCNFMADYALWMAGLPLPVLDGKMDYFALGSIESINSENQCLLTLGWDYWFNLKNNPYFDNHPSPFVVSKKSQIKGSLDARICPILLDLDGDGVETTSVNDRWVMFDLDGDGVKNRTGWANSDDGFLVFDRNNDGIINDGREMLGNHIINHLDLI